VAGSCGHGIGHSGFIKRGEISSPAKQLSASHIVTLVLSYIMEDINRPILANRPRYVECVMQTLIMTWEVEC
jgi:hypothetical protein